MWEYRATVERTVDGDTVDLTIDLGFETYRAIRVRLNGIDAPEMNSSDPEERARAKMVRDHINTIIPTGSIVRVVTIKDRTEKYGRYLADIYPHSWAETLQSSLLTAGLVKAYYGGKR